jgi:hypothetical protein
MNATTIVRSLLQNVFKINVQQQQQQQQRQQQQQQQQQQHPSFKFKIFFNASPAKQLSKNQNYLLLKSGLTEMYQRMNFN